ncbi:hypothetical protein OSCT_0784 [Oscillochloris trichoides DG-6]|uniref:Uncharacterized protein n=1 Tax=Oscillochloris trichoides DG-6 TaxID=765420 RepID=E1IBT3_9CHLR|nr:hypothetical protein OSCT_0784 [Oscillochloris trichoides DG-6]
MYARKKVIRLDIQDDQGFEEALSICSLDEKSKLAIRKDLHLLSAALMADEIIISSDEALRNLLRTFCLYAIRVKSIMYANPTLEQDYVIEWLRNGAVPEKKRRIGTDVE